jgi:hypothetical protein
MTGTNTWSSRATAARPIRDGGRVRSNSLTPLGDQAASPNRPAVRSHKYVTSERSSQWAPGRHYRIVLMKMKEATQYHQKKSQAWSAIAADFNMSARISRDSDILKRKYEKKVKSQICRRKTENVGRFEETQVNAIDEKLRSMLGVQVTGDVSEFDSDSVLHGEEIGRRFNSRNQ